MRKQWLDLTTELQAALAGGLNSLGGKPYAGAHDAFVFYSAVQINRAVLGYVVLAKSDYNDSAVFSVRPAIEAMFRMKAVKNRPEVLVQIAFGEMREERKMVEGFDDGPDKTRALAALDAHWTEFRDAYKKKHPEHPFVEARITVEQLAKLAGLEPVYGTHYRLYCKFTHCALRAVTGDFKEVMMRDAGIMAVISMNAIQAIISVGANVPTFADLEQKFRTVDGEDRAGMSNPA